MGGKHCVIWFDNYVRPRGFVDPSRGFRLFDCTVFGVLRAAHLPPFAGLPDITHLVDRRRVVLAELLSFHPVFVDLLEDVRNLTLGHADVRVPLDVVRSEGSSPRWCPLAVSGHRVTSSEGLINLLGWCRELTDHVALPMPLCVDENIHYRLLKLCYGQYSHRYNVSEYLRRAPPLYGVWHAYKYVVTVVYRAYYSHFLYLLNGELAAGRTFPSKQRIRSVEMVLAVLLEHRDTVREELRATIVTLALQQRTEGPGGPAATRLRNLLALQNLLEVYAPVCFLLGWQARNCVWANRRLGTGAKAKELLMGCLFVLLALTEGDSHHCEYVRTLLTALLCWTRWHSDVPGACYTDESNEASLAQLGRWWSQHSEVADVEMLMNMYVLVPSAGRRFQDQTISRPSAGLRQGILARLRALIRRPREVIAYVPWEPVRLCRVVGPWPLDAWFPKDLSERPSGQYLRDLLKYVLGTLVTQAPLRMDLRRALAGIGLREETGAAVLARQRAVQTLLNDIPVRLRAAAVRRVVGVPAPEDDVRDDSAL